MTSGVNVCPACGKPSISGAKECAHCGQILEKSGDSAVALFSLRAWLLSLGTIFKQKASSIIGRDSIGQDQIGGDKVGKDKFTVNAEDSTDAVFGNQNQQIHIEAETSAPINQYSANSITFQHIEQQQNVGDIQLATKRATVEIKIDRKLEEFSEQDQAELMRTIQSLLNLKETEIRIISTRPGSVLMAIELPQDKIRQLVELVKAGKLKEHLVTQINLDNADLREVDLHETNLTIAGLRAADLSAANLRGADLSAADLNGANLRRADLSGANLHRADLRRADLSGANLSGANLSRARYDNLTQWPDQFDYRSSGAVGPNAYLSGVNLREAYLRRSDLREADLRGANLTWADLREANLRGADLREANLRGANLSGADLTHADLQGADLRQTNLTTATLDLVKHDIHTKWPDDLDFVRPLIPISKR